MKTEKQFKPINGFLMMLLLIISIALGGYLLVKTQNSSYGVLLY